MIRESASHKFKAVIVWKMDRFARSREIASKYKKELKNNGVNLYYAMENVPEGSSGIIFDGLLESMAEYYSANLSENIQRGYYDSALEHKTLGLRVLGYKKDESDHFVIDPVTAPIVRRIFEEYAAGRKYSEIIHDLNADGLKTAHGGEFRPNSLRKILRNEKYIGVYKFKDLIRDENVIPPIIDRELFDRVQASFKGAVSRRSVNDFGEDGQTYLLTTKLFCGHCGEPMTGESARSKTGRIYYYYSCNGTKSKRRNGCKKKRVAKDKIEAEVIRLIGDEVMTDEFIASVADAFMEDQEKDARAEKLASLEAQLKDINKKIDNIIKAIEDGLYSENMKERMTTLEETQKDLEHAIRAEKIAPPKISRETVVNYLKNIREGSRADSNALRVLIFEFIDKIFLFDEDDGNGRIVITTKLSDQSFEMTLGDVQEIVREDCPKLHSLFRGLLRSPLFMVSLLFPNIPVTSK